MKQMLLFPLEFQYFLWVIPADPWGKDALGLRVLPVETVNN